MLLLSTGQEIKLIPATEITSQLQALQFRRRNKTMTRIAILPIFLLNCMAVVAQSPSTGKASVKGDCNQAITGSNNTVTLRDCGIGSAESKELMKELKKIYRQKSSDQEDQPRPGFTLFALLNISKLPEQHNHYLFDFGEANRNRFSVYLRDADSALALSVLDDRGHRYSMDIPVGSNGLPVGQESVLTASFGYGAHESYLSLYVDEKETGRLVIPTVVAIRDLGYSGFSVGGSVDGSSPSAAFRLYCFGTSVTMETKEQVIQNAEALRKVQAAKRTAIGVKQNHQSQ